MKTITILAILFFIVVLLFAFQKIKEYGQRLSQDALKYDMKYLWITDMLYAADPADYEKIEQGIKDIEALSWKEKEKTATLKSNFDRIKAEGK